jgi:hypothetical protein
MLCRYLLNARIDLEFEVNEMKGETMSIRTMTEVAIISLSAWQAASAQSREGEK